MRAIKLLLSLALLSLPTAVPAVAAGVGETCDGIAAIQCDAGLWCEHPSGQCNTVCGCDGETYGNQCMASAAKTQVDHIGECTE